MRVWGAIVLAVCLGVPGGWAKPLLDSSEESYASACIAYEDTSDRIIEICEIALEGVGFSDEQQASMEENLAIALMDVDRLDEAQALYEAMLERNAREERAVRGLGWVAHGREDFATAVTYFQQALDLKSDFRSLAGLGDSLLELGEIDLDEALTYFDAALAIEPEYHWAIRQKGWQLLLGGRGEEARDLFSSLLEEYPEDSNSRAGLLEVYNAWGDHENALAHANFGLEFDPSSAYFIEGRARGAVLSGPLSAVGQRGRPPY